MALHGPGTSMYFLDLCFLRILTPPMVTPDPPSDTPGASKEVFLTPHDIPRILGVIHFCSIREHVAAQCNLTHHGILQFCTAKSHKECYTTNVSWGFLFNTFYTFCLKSFMTKNNFLYVKCASQNFKKKRAVWTWNFWCPRRGHPIAPSLEGEMTGRYHLCHRHHHQVSLHPCSFGKKKALNKDWKWSSTSF